MNLRTIFYICTCFLTSCDDTHKNQYTDLMQKTGLTPSTGIVNVALSDFLFKDVNTSSTKNTEWTACLDQIKYTLKLNFEQKTGFETILNTQQFKDQQCETPEEHNASIDFLTVLGQSFIPFLAKKDEHQNTYYAPLENKPKNINQKLKIKGVYITPYHQTTVDFFNNTQPYLYRGNRIQFLSGQSTEIAPITSITPPASAWRTQLYVTPVQANDLIDKELDLSILFDEKKEYKVLLKADTIQNGLEVELHASQKEQKLTY